MVIVATPQSGRFVALRQSSKLTKNRLSGMNRSTHHKFKPHRRGRERGRERGSERQREREREREGERGRGEGKGEGD